MKKEEVMQALKIDAKELEKALKEGELKQLATIDSRKKFRDSGEFQKLRSTPPVLGDVITSENGEVVTVFEDFRVKDNQPVRVLYCNAIVDETSKKWILHSRTFGLKCIISLSSHSKFIKKPLEATQLKVVHVSTGGKSVICDVA